MRRLADIRVLLVGIALMAALLIALDWLVREAPDDGDGEFAAIDAYVQQQMNDSRIPGVALAIVTDGQIVHARGFGHDGRGDDVTPQTPFWIGSNTKSFTALATMQLEEAGLVELDAPVQRYLPEFTTADAEASAHITVRHLLNQTSGFSREDGIAMVAEAREQTLEEAVRVSAPWS